MPSLNQQIFIGALLGLLVGGVLTQLGDASPVREWSLYACTLSAGIFVDLLKMILVPLIFSTIVVGVANLQAHQQIHRRSFLNWYFFAGQVFLRYSSRANGTAVYDLD